MLSAFASGARILNEPRYREIAERAATELLRTLRPDRQLHHSYKDGQRSPHAFAADYAFLAAGLLDLFEVTSEPGWLERAIELMNDLEHGHLDTEHGGYYLTATDHERLIAREKPGYDGAIPSANPSQR